MVDWASHEIDLNKTDDDGITQREHLEQVQKQTGRVPIDLENPTEFPMALAHVWSYFLELHMSRSPGVSGPSPLSYPDIRAWQELTGVELSAIDVKCIKLLDLAYLKSSH